MSIDPLVYDGPQVAIHCDECGGSCVIPADRDYPACESCYDNILHELIDRELG